MPYANEITRANPSCFLFLVDQSKSMLERMAGSANKTKAQAVADAINSLLCNLCQICQKGQAILDRLFVGVIGYGVQVAPALGGALTGRDLVPISEVARHTLRVEQREEAGGPTSLFPVWFDPVAQGRTPMCAALSQARMLLAGFLAEHPSCFPPIVINITDGKATDGDPFASAAELCGLSSTDGNVLLFNAHISEQDGFGVMLPDCADFLPDELAQRLFHMSSVLPAPILDSAEQAGFAVSPQTRGFVFNGNLDMVVQFLRVGTSTTRGRLRM